jgi:2',3'-cyclic-nucleotide 2'-phosphodiesterase (5'-nucleotidase family)
VDNDIESIIKPYREQIQEEMSVIVGYLDNDLIKRQPEGTLGNFVADAILDQANTIHPEKVDFAVQNNGGIRVGALSRGGVTKGRVFEVMPFDNLLVVIKADSALVHKFCDHMAKGSGWPVSRNIRFQIDGDVAVHIEVNGAPLSDDQTYVFATNDYIVNGGDHCGFLEEDALEVYRYDKLIRDLIIDHLKENFPKNDPAQVVMEGRIKRL